MTFTALPGQVTGFAGPNGAGKSTTMRVILGLDRPDSGTALVGGRPYQTFEKPLRHVGSLLDAGALQPARSARGHLLWLARSQDLPARRVGEVLELTGLTAVAGRRAGGFSLGMRQRLGIAAAMLGDPPVLMFDEPFNGMDPEGIVWLRGLLRSLAAQGRTVLVASHLMSELQEAADHVIIVGRGQGVRMQDDFTGDIAGPVLAAGWLRLVRSGDTITGYASGDGATWTKVGTVTLPGLPATVQGGLFVTSPQYTQTSLGVASISGSESQSTATFDRVALTWPGTAWRGTAWAGTQVGGSSGGPARGPAIGYSHADGAFTITGSGDIAPVTNGPSGIGATLSQALGGVFVALIILAVVGRCSLPPSTGAG